MINASDIEKIIDRFALLLEYGLSNNYSLEVMEERFISSEMFVSLEKSHTSFLFDRDIKEEIRLIYALNHLEEIEVIPYSSKCLWLSKVYIRLFFKFHKSFTYIFLYFPIKDLLSYYPIYHEMDFIKLDTLFLEKTNEISLLRKLMNKRNISIMKLSALSNIDTSNIRRYISNDEYLYRASYMNIYALSRVLDVNSNVFIKDLDNYTNSDEYAFDRTNKEYRSYLALYLISYYSLEIKNRKYVYDKKNSYFTYENKIFKVLFTETLNGYEKSVQSNKEIIDAIDLEAANTSKEERNNTILVVFEYNQISEAANAYLNLLKYGYEKIYIINQENIICIDNSNYYATYVPISIKNFLIEKAKKAYGVDFAI